MRSRRSLLFLAALLLTPAAVRAQINPFWSNRAGGHLSAQDVSRLGSSIDRLNAVTPPRIGESASWSNPATRSSGTSSLQRIFQSGGMTCHLLRHHISTAGSRSGRTFDLTWCRTPSGEWKIKS